jgi:hypothetical protein
MDTCTAPKALWVDLRTTWAGHYNEYTSDGIHCTDAGGAATAKTFWDAMKANNWAFFDDQVSIQQEKFGANPAVKLAIQSQVARNGNVAVSLSIDHPSNIRFNWQLFPAAVF